MIKWYVSVRRLLRDIEKKSRDALTQHEKGETDGARSTNQYLKSDYQKLSTLWREQFPDGPPSNLGRHIRFGMDGDYRDILNNDLVEIEQIAEAKLLETARTQGPLGFEHLLHPLIEMSCYDQFRNGYLRDAVVNSVIAVFDPAGSVRCASRTSNTLACVFRLMLPTSSRKRVPVSAF